MLINIQMITNIFLEKNNNSEEARKAILVKLVNLIDVQYNKMNELLQQDKNINRYLFDSCSKAYEHYVKNQDKKINDLITLPNILIPIIFIDKIDSIPEYLKEENSTMKY
jgi:ATP-dependent Zn protease